MTYSVTFADLQAQAAAVVADEAAPDDIGSHLGAAFEEVARIAAAQGVQLVGPPFARYHRGADRWLFEAGFPVAGAVTPEGRVRPTSLPGGHVVWTTHAGRYEGLGSAYEALSTCAIENGFECLDGAWERYLDGPDVPMPRTEVFVPCRRVVPHVTTG
ncbi:MULTISPECIES: GyrI-like domain-containing protein [unclassified Nocardioides]|uniref:GyrI-like domain-containing protein n=1 Tax=unclassified Nocardioides TaxID=2615069 RepID=UPI003614312B